MKVYKFFLDKEVPGVKAYEEEVEFDDDITEEEVTEIFTEWVFDKLDSAFFEIKDK